MGLGSTIVMVTLAWHYFALGVWKNSFMREVRQSSVSMLAIQTNTCIAYSYDVYWQYNYFRASYHRMEELGICIWSLIHHSNKPPIHGITAIQFMNYFSAKLGYLISRSNEIYGQKVEQKSCKKCSFSKKISQSGTFVPLGHGCARRKHSGTDPYTLVSTCCLNSYRQPTGRYRQRQIWNCRWRQKCLSDQCISGSTKLRSLWLCSQ